MDHPNPSLRDDLERANEQSKLHLWGGIGSAVVSFLIPLVGLVAVYTGYELTNVMSRTWFGAVIATFGAVNFGIWIYVLAFVL